jgi:hypothetical protein
MRPRGVRILLVSGLLLMAPGAPAAAQSELAAAPTLVTGAVTGRFQSEVRSLPFAMVEVLSGSARHRAITDADGRYVVQGLEPGEVTLSVRHAAYEPVSLMVVVPGHQTVSVDIELLAAPVRLTPLDVRADSRTRVRGISGVDDESKDTELEMQALEVGPGLAEPGIADVIGALPGNDPGNATDILLMRGSTTDLKLVLLDGVPVYTPFHVAGLMRSFEPGVIGAAELHVGGAPARFDGGLSQILELTTRTARRDRIHVSSSVDLLSASGALEAPLGSKAGLVASARGLHDLGNAFGGERPYGYHDALVSADFEPAAGHDLRVTGFLNDESVKLDLSPSDESARWANLAGSVGYHVDLGAADLRVTAGLSDYRATLPLQPRAGALEPLPPAVLASGATDRSRVVGEVAFGGAATTVRTGVSYEHIDVAFSARELNGTNQASSHGSTEALGGFVDATQNVGANVSIRTGLRVDHFRGRSARVAPRAAITWAVAPGAVISIAAGRYHQPTRTPDVDVGQTLVAVAETGVPPADLLPIATADHVVFSLDHRLSEYVRIALQGFWKTYSGLPSAGGTGVRSSGLDMRILRGSERAAAWLGYGLQWYWSAADLGVRSTDFSGRHLLTAGLSGHLGGPVRGEARVSFGAGLPYTSIPVSASAVPEPGTSDLTAEPYVTNPFESTLEDSFLRVDLELYAILRPAWGARGWTVRPYVRVMNALGRRDSLFYAFESWRSDSVRPITELPVLPLVGVAVSF